MARRKFKLKQMVCRGQPTDGKGRLCIHFLVRDKRGPIVEPHAVHPVYKDGEQVKQVVQCLPTRFRLACNPHRKVAPVTRGGVTTLTHRSEETYAVTCEACKSTKEFAEAVERISMVQ